MATVAGRSWPRSRHPAAGLGLRSSRTARVPARIVTASARCVSLNPQPLPPRESVHRRPAARRTSLSSRDHRRRWSGRRRGAGVALLARSTTGAARAGRGAGPRRRPPEGWDDGMVFAGAALAAAQLADQYDHCRRCRRPSARPRAGSPRPPSRADTARRTARKPSRPAPATRPTIGRWNRAPSPRCCASTGTSCAPPPPTGRRRRTGTPSPRSVPHDRSTVLAEIHRLLLAGTRLRA